MNLMMAWRNIWRNPRRTLVILSAVVAGVWGMVVLGAVIRGINQNMFENGIKVLTGHIQIHAKKYRNDPSISNSIENADRVLAGLPGLLPPASRFSSRIRVSAVVSNARHSAGVTLVGMDPEAEKAVSFIGSAVTKGKYLSPDDNRGILVGRALVEKFNAKIGRKLVVMSQSWDGEVASKAFRIRGIYESEMEDTEKRYAFITLASARKMLKLENGVSEICLMLPENADIEKTAQTLAASLPDTLAVHTWKQILPMLDVMVRLNEDFNFIWYLVVFVAMGFGIVNTTLMAVFERMREFGILKALGMTGSRIVRGVLLESFMILVLGAVAGNLLGGLFILILARTGIDLSAFSQASEMFGMSRIIYPQLTGADIISANFVVVVLGLLVSLYPALKAARITPVKALRHT